MFDVGSDQINSQLTWLAAAIILLVLISLVPWGRDNKPGRMLTNLPLASLPLYYLYETTMPSGTGARVDLFVILPALAFIIMRWLKKVGWLDRNPPT